MSKDPPIPQPPDAKSGMSVIAKVLLGCGITAAIGLFVCCGGLFFVYRWGMGQVEAYAVEFEAKGYERQMAQVISVDSSPTTPSVYLCQVLKIDNDVNVDVAVLAQVMEVNAKIDGDIDFKGQILHVKPNGIVTGEIRVAAAQVIKIEGVVEGDISGDYQVLDDQRREETKQLEETNVEIESDPEAVNVTNGEEKETAPEE